MKKLQLKSFMAFISLSIAAHRITKPIVYFLYYTYRNLVYYKKMRKVDHSRHIKLDKAEDTSSAKDELTSLCLASLGLKIVDNEFDTIPWYIPLSKKQKKWLKMVSDFGYKVGLM